MKKKIVVLFMLFAAGYVYADGKATYMSFGCGACHGNNGISTMPLYPNLAGQKAAYTVKQLNDYKNGIRKDPTMTAMAPLIAGKEQEIADWLESLK